MRILHTSDWHVGKQLRGRSRAGEHRAVLAEIADIADAEDVEMVLVAGDLFDTAAPSPESEEMVFAALLRLARPDRHVAVIGGNHDNARRLRAIQPLLAGCGVTLVSEPTRPAEGGVQSLVDRNGTPVRLAMLPFVSQRGIVRAEQLMSAAAFENALLYSQRLRLVIDTLSNEFRSDAVNLMMAHAFVLGGVAGGGERAGHLTDEYAIPSLSFPASAGYVAMGHLHRAQVIPGATAIHYCGSPLQLDFGETADVKQVNIVDIEPGIPAAVTPIRLRSGRVLRTHSGTIDDLRASVPDDDAWLRLVVTEPHRAGLGDDVRSMFGERVVEVRVVAPGAHRVQRSDDRRQERSPIDLFAEFMAHERVADRRVATKFAELLELESEPSPS